MATTLVEPRLPPPEPRPVLRSPPDLGRPRRRHDDGRLSWLAFALSVLLHAILFMTLYWTIARPTANQGPAPHLPFPVQAPVMQVVPIQVVPGPVAEAAPPVPAPTGRERRPPATQFQPSIPQPNAPSAPRVPGAAGAAPSAAQRLEIQEGDQRLWTPVDMLPVEPSPIDRARSRVAAEIQEYNDSLAAEGAARTRALDWTIHGKNGERWGIAPDGIHLGNITLPLPQFEGNAATRQATQEWQTIQQQADRASIHDRFKERVKAIRERKDAERDAKKKKNDKSGSGSSHGS